MVAVLLINQAPDSASQTNEWLLTLHQLLTNFVSFLFFHVKLGYLVLFLKLFSI